MGSWRPPRTLRVLKTAQEALGQAHDREVLLRRVRDFSDTQRSSDPDGLVALEHYLRAEIREWHQKFLVSSRELFAVCDACTAVRSSRRSALALATGVVVPTLVFMRRRAG